MKVCTPSCDETSSRVMPEEGSGESGSASGAAVAASFAERLSSSIRRGTTSSTDSASAELLTSPSPPSTPPPRWRRSPRPSSSVTLRAIADFTKRSLVPGAASSSKSSSPTARDNAVEAADGNDLVSDADAFDQTSVLLGPLLLRPDQHEVEDSDEESDEQELRECG